MAENIKDYVWTIKTITEYWESNNVNYKADNIRKRFKNFLTETLMFSEEEVSWFRTKTHSEKGGEFIFGYKTEKTPEEMEKLFKIEEKKFITIDEKYELIKCLENLLPLYRKVDTFKVQEEWEKSVYNKNEDLELYKILDKEDNRTYKQDNRIGELVDEYYQKMHVLDGFLSRLFHQVDGKKICRKLIQKRIYCYQYHLILEWTLKWYFIMQNIEAVRIAERFENGYKECERYNLSKEDAQKFYKTGKIENPDLATSYKTMAQIGINDLYSCLKVMYEEQKKSQEVINGLTQKLNLDKDEEDKDTNERCREGCSVLVDKILKNSLVKTAKEDYAYIIEMAYQELEEISDKVRKRQDEEVYCDKVKGRERTDIETLNKVREMIENKNRKRTALELIRLQSLLA